MFQCGCFPHSALSSHGEAPVAFVERFGESGLRARVIRHVFCHVFDAWFDPGLVNVWILREVAEVELGIPPVGRRLSNNIVSSSIAITPHAACDVEVVCVRDVDYAPVCVLVFFFK